MRHLEKLVRELSTSLNTTLSDAAGLGLLPQTQAPGSPSMAAPPLPAGKAVTIKSEASPPLSSGDVYSSPSRSRQSPSSSSSQHPPLPLQFPQSHAQQHHHAYQYYAKPEDAEDADAQEDAAAALARPQYAGSTRAFRSAYFAALARRAARLEDSALRSAVDVHLAYLPIPLARRALAAYWAWVHPVHQTLHRATFIRDMAEGEPAEYTPQNSFSPALLAGMLAAALPLLGEEDAGALAGVVAQHAHALLLRELQQPPTLATVAAAQHRAAAALLANDTPRLQLFAAAALRLAQHLDLGRLPGTIAAPLLSIEHAEARGRLAWALFAWDLHAALYLGHAPTLAQTPSPRAELDASVADTSGDGEPWRAVGDPRGDAALAAELRRAVQDPGAARGLKRRASGTLRADAKGKSIAQQSVLLADTTAAVRTQHRVAAVLHETLTQVFGTGAGTLATTALDVCDPPQGAGAVGSVRGQLEQLRRVWEDDTPAGLKMDVEAASTVHPTHVASSLQYHAGRILLHTLLLQLSRQTQAPAQSSSSSSSDVEDALGAVRGVVRVLAAHAQDYGARHESPWHAAAPLAAARYLLTLLRGAPRLAPAQHSAATACLRALIPVLQGGAAGTPRAAETVAGAAAVLAGAQAQQVVPQQQPPAPIQAAVPFHVAAVPQVAPAPQLLPQMPPQQPPAGHAFHAFAVDPAQQQPQQQQPQYAYPPQYPEMVPHPQQQQQQYAVPQFYAQQHGMYPFVVPPPPQQQQHSPTQHTLLPASAMYSALPFAPQSPHQQQQQQHPQQQQPGIAMMALGLVHTPSTPAAAAMLEPQAFAGAPYDLVGRPLAYDPAPPNPPRAAPPPAATPSSASSASASSALATPVPHMAAAGAAGAGAAAATGPSTTYHHYDGLGGIAEDPAFLSAFQPTSVATRSRHHSSSGESGGNSNSSRPRTESGRESVLGPPLAAGERTARGRAADTEVDTAAAPVSSSSESGSSGAGQSAGAATTTTTTTTRTSTAESASHATVADSLHGLWPGDETAADTDQQQQHMPAAMSSGVSMVMLPSTRPPSTHPG